MIDSLVLWHGRIAITEFLWTIFGLLGLYVNFGSMRDAKKDKELLYILRLNGTLKKIAHNHFVSNVMRVLVNVIVVTIGIVAMTQKPLVANQPVSVTGMVVTIGLLCIVGISIINSYSDRRFRHTLMREDSESNEQESEHVDL